jgi:hypothetical protein
MNYRFPLIGFTGAAGAGKTTAAKFLVGLGYKKVSFADPLRDMLHVLGVPCEVMADPVAKEQPHPALNGKTPRYALQTLGTEWGRETISPTLWTDTAMRRAARLRGLGLGVVFDDVRFDNEARAVRAAGGVIIRLQLDGTVQTTHKSEAGVDESLVDFNFYAGSRDVRRLHEFIQNELL